MFIFKKKQRSKASIKNWAKKRKKRQSVHQENADTNVIKAAKWYKQRMLLNCGLANRGTSGTSETCGTYIFLHKKKAKKTLTLFESLISGLRGLL